MQNHAWMFFNEPLEQVRDDGEGDCQWACNPDFPRSRISQVLDILDALFQFIKSSHAPFEQCVAIHRWFDPMGRSIEKPHAERVLKIGDDLRNRRLRNAELYRRFGHAALLNDHVEHVEVAQAETPADLALPVDFAEHRVFLIRIETNREFPLYPGAAMVSMRVRTTLREDLDCSIWSSRPCECERLFWDR